MSLAKKIASGRGSAAALSAVLVLAGFADTNAFAQDAPVDGSAATSAVARQLAGDYARQQVDRLAKKGGRDNLIAAALIGMPNDSRSTEVPGEADLLKRLATEFASDPLAVYTAALVCNTQPEACTQPEFQAQLLPLESDNAIAPLLVAQGATLESAQLHLAAQAGKADTHFSELLGIVRAALAKQRAPESPVPNVDAKELALVLRRNEVGSVPWPSIAPVTGLCTAALAFRPESDAALHADCLKLGQLLFADAGHNLVTRMYGGTLVRRFAPGSATAAEALEFRRQYVWLSELPEPRASAEKELINEEEAQVGEWEAMLRRADRAQVARSPAADWAPKQPELILLPEERAQPSGKP